MPVEMRWIIKRDAKDPTSGSLQADATSGFLRYTARRSPPYIPPHAGGKLSPSPRVGSALCFVSSGKSEPISLPACGEGWGGADPGHWRAAERTLDNPKLWHAPDNQVPPKG